MEPSDRCRGTTSSGLSGGAPGERLLRSTGRRDRATASLRKGPYRAAAYQWLRRLRPTRASFRQRAVPGSMDAPAADGPTMIKRRLPRNPRALALGILL